MGKISTTAVASALLAVAATLTVAGPSRAGQVLSYSTTASNFNPHNSLGQYFTDLEPLHSSTGAFATATYVPYATLIPENTPVVTSMGSFLVTIGTTSTNANDSPFFSLHVNQSSPTKGNVTELSTMTAQIHFVKGSDASSVVELVFKHSSFTIGSMVYTLGTLSGNHVFTPLTSNTFDLAVPGALGTATTTLYADVALAAPEPSTIVGGACAVLFGLGLAWRRHRRAAA